MSDMETVIEDAVQDSITPEPIDTSLDTSSEVVEDTSTETVDEPSSDQLEVKQTGEDLADAAVEAVEDEFGKKFGLQSQGVTGRENRIPSSRVKKIVAKAESEDQTAAQKEFETQFQPKIAEFETKVRDYEERLTRVAQFENILENDPKTFLNMLSEVPAYKPFFDYISQLSQTPAQQQQPPVLGSEMPQPDQTLTDGSKVYSMEAYRSS